jgi:capsular exopolysaccharide synthesis family protein
MDNQTPPIKVVSSSNPKVERTDPAARSRAARQAALPERHVLDKVRVLYRRRWAAATICLAISVSLIVRSFTTTPVYEASVQLLIDKESSNVVTFKQAVEQNQITDDYYQTQYKILQSRALARRTIAALDLWNSPALFPPPRAGVGRWLGRTSRSLMPRWFASPPRRMEPPTPDETVPESIVVNALLGHLTVTPVRGSRLVDVKFQSADPAFAARVANGLSKAFIEQNLEFKFMASKEASDWLSDRLAEQRKLVEGSELALQRYREQADAISLEERQNIVVQKLADLNAAVTRAKTERIQKEAVYNQILAVQKDRRALDTIPAILSNSFIQQQKNNLADLQRQQAQLADKLGPNHPDMVTLSTAIRSAESKIEGEIGKVVQAMRNDYQAALAQERSLSNALNEQKDTALELNRKGIDYGALQRDASTNRQIFESLLQRAKETGISGELKTNNIRVVDAAEPPTLPVRPQTRTDVAGAIFWGLLFSLMGVLLLEYMDNRIKNPDELSQALGLPFLGIVPMVSSERSDPLVTDQALSHFAESFRGIRTNVLFSSTETGPRSLVVTSTAPNEGKTLVASNLAIVLAQAGQRVLLIDADMRKPRVSAVLQTKTTPGLSNVLVGNTPLARSVVMSKHPGLWVLPAGVIPPNAAELLGSDRFRDMLASVGSHFDYIVIDAPPVMAVTDASIVAHVATAVVYVVGCEMTARQVARRGLEQLEHAQAKIIGCVLNRVDVRRHAYYYAPYYRRDYTEHYQKHPVAM